MKKIEKLKYSIKNTRFSFQRFPIVMTLAILLTIILIIITRNSSAGDEVRNLTRLAYTTGFAMFAFMFIRLLIEGLSMRFDDMRSIRVGLKVLGLVLVLYIYFFIVNNLRGGELIYSNKFYFFGLIFFYTVCCFYIGKLYNFTDIVPYVIKVLFAGLMSNIYSIVLYIGISAIYFTLGALFGLNIPENIYVYSALIIFIPINIGIFLSNYPKTTDNYEDYKVAKSFRVLLEYILTPILLVYSLILYVYFAKILITRELPQNIITNLALWFGMVSVGVVFFQTWIKDKKVSGYFTKYFPIVILPLLTMMFFAIFLRIRQYGFTEKRYFVLALGIWVALSFIYLILSKNKTKIVIPIILSIIALVSSVGPASAYSVTSYSQFNRFEDILVKNGMLVKNKIIPNSNISTEDKERISSIVSFMLEGHDKGELEYLPENYGNKDFEKIFGFDSQNLTTEVDSLNYYLDDTSEIEIAGYNKLYKVNSYAESIGVEYTQNSGDMNIIISANSQDELNAQTELVRINMEEVRNKLSVLTGENVNIKPEDLSVKGSNLGVDYKIIFIDLSFNYNSQDMQDFYANYLLLINDVGRE